MLNAFNRLFPLGLARDSQYMLNAFNRLFLLGLARDSQYMLNASTQLVLEYVFVEKRNFWGHLSDSAAFKKCAHFFRPASSVFLIYGMTCCLKLLYIAVI